jgi:uncharacterized membrane protein YhiD involved in acid resistance
MEEVRGIIRGLEAGLQLIAVVLLGAGTLLMVAPDVVAKANAWCNRHLFTDQGALKHARVTGAAFVGIGVILFALITASR